MWKVECRQRRTLGEITDFIMDKLLLAEERKFRKETQICQRDNQSSSSVSYIDKVASYVITSSQQVIFT